MNGNYTVLNFTQSITYSAKYEVLSITQINLYKLQFYCLLGYKILQNLKKYSMLNYIQVKSKFSTIQVPHSDIVFCRT